MGPEEQGEIRQTASQGNPPVETRFKPGQSGNPGGRPKGRSLTARLRELLEKGEINGKPIPGGRQVADLVVEAMVKGAIKGNSKLIVEVLDRNDGKVPEKHEHMGPDGGPMAFDGTVLTFSSAEIEAWQRQQKERLASVRQPGGDPSSS